MSTETRFAAERWTSTIAVPDGEGADRATCGGLRTEENDASGNPGAPVLPPREGLQDAYMRTREAVAGAEITDKHSAEWPCVI